MHRTFSFPLLHCYSAMDVYKCKCNTATNTKIIKIWVFRVDPIYLSCPANTIYDLPINLLYIHKRVPALVISLWIMPMKEKGNKIQKKSSNQKRWFLCKKYRSEGNISFVICSLLWQFLRTDIVFNRPWHIHFWPHRWILGILHKGLGLRKVLKKVLKKALKKIVLTQKRTQKSKCTFLSTQKSTQ